MERLPAPEFASPRRGHRKAAATATLSLKMPTATLMGVFVENRLRGRATCNDDWWSRQVVARGCQSGVGWKISELSRCDFSSRQVACGSWCWKPHSNCAWQGLNLEENRAVDWWHCVLCLTLHNQSSHVDCRGHAASITQHIECCDPPRSAQRRNARALRQNAGQ